MANGQKPYTHKQYEVNEKVYKFCTQNDLNH